MNRVETYVKALEKFSSKLHYSAPACSSPSQEKTSEYYKQSYITEQFEQELYYHNQGRDSGSSYKKIDNVEFNVFSLWQMSGVKNGTTLSDLNISYESTPTIVQIDWGDQTEPEPITSGVNYTHSFVL